MHNPFTSPTSFPLPIQMVLPFVCPPAVSRMGAAMAPLLFLDRLIVVMLKVVRSDPFNLDLVLTFSILIASEN